MVRNNGDTNPTSNAPLPAYVSLFCLPLTLPPLNPPALTPSPLSSSSQSQPSIGEGMVRLPLSPFLFLPLSPLSFSTPFTFSIIYSLLLLIPFNFAIRFLNRTLGNTPTGIPSWPHATWIPHAVFINLGWSSFFLSLSLSLISRPSFAPPLTSPHFFSSPSPLFPPASDFVLQAPMTSVQKEE